MDTRITEPELSNFIKSLADAERLKIAGLLGVEALSVEDAAQRLGMDLTQVAQHLEVLEANGLAYKEGNAYRLDSQALEKLTRRVLAQSQPPALEYEGDEFEVKTLRAYLSGMDGLNPSPTSKRSCWLS